MRSSLLPLLLFAEACAHTPSPNLPPRNPFEIRIPTTDLKRRAVDLEASLYRPVGPGPFPLVVISHGSPRLAVDRRRHDWYQYARQRAWFLKRGYAVLVPLRRGFGTSGGDFDEAIGRCEDPDYVGGTHEAARDIRSAIEQVLRDPSIDRNRIILVGQSAGGFATLALASENFPGVIAAISFAGGRGSFKPDMVCAPERLIAAVGLYGQTVRVPTLWIYAENDHFFAPALVRQLHDAFVAAGGHADLHMTEPFGSDGHRLFSEPLAWASIVEPFLATLLPPP